VELSITVCLHETEIGRYQNAYQHAIDACTASIKLYGEDHVQTTYAKYRIGLTLERLGKYEDSKRVLEEVLRQEEKSRGDEQNSVLKCAISLGVAHDNLGNYETASTFAQQAPEGYRALSNKTGIIEALSLQARLLLRQGESDKAESIYRQLLKDSTDMWGENHTKTLQIMSAYSIAVRKRDSAESA
jgi:tetratricopeptide (TPR) repeat protein